MTRRVLHSESPVGALAARYLAGTNLERAADHNQRITLHAIRVNGPVTRTDLALMTGLTTASIANITKRLLRHRLILEAGTTSGSRGQPATKLIVNLDSCYALGLNIDRDHITLVVVDFAGRVRARASREVKFALPNAVRSFFQHSVGRLLNRAQIDARKVVGIGVAFPDDIQHAGLPGQPPEYAVWGGTSVENLLAGVLPAPVLVENDAAAAAMGEMQFGLGHQYSSFFYVLITAALGGGVVLDGHYVRGATGRSGELGMLREHVAAGKARQLQKIVSLSALYDLLANAGYNIGAPHELVTLEGPAQQIVTHWIETSAEALEDAFVAINCLLNPQAVLIGGRLPAALVDRLATRLNERLASHRGMIPAIAPVARAAMSDDAPAVGAGILPFSERFLPTRFALMKSAS